MSLFRSMTSAYVLNRILRGGRRRSYPRGYGRSYPRGYGRRSRGRVGFFGPFPHYSTRTRGGSRVSVSGCCLPIPLAFVASLGVAVRALARR
jgi:hypothetical protein